VRRLLVRSALLLALAAAAGVAWLTGHPGSPWIDRAAGWPGIGPLAVRFRDAYRPRPSPPPPPPAAEGAEIEVVTIWLPERSAPLALPPRGAAAAPGGTVRPAESAPGEPPLGRAAEPPRPLPGRSADPERLRAAETRLGASLQRTAAGPYGLLVDARLAPPLERWGALAGALDAAYAERTGQAPIGEPAETVVLFADEAAYRDFQGLETRIAGIPTGGHASAGLAALWSLDRTPDEIESTLVHELVHFVSRRALGPALPPWLDEGLAEDLAQTPFDAAHARFEPGGFRVDVTRTGERIAIRGGLAALDLAARALDGPARLPVADLLRLDWEGFVGAAAPVRYAQALVWIRFLLDGGDAGRAARFREFLAGVARGEPADGARLLDLLGEDPAELEAALAAWVRRERALRFVAAGLPPPPAAQPAAGASGSSSRQAAPPSP